jgi:hypothetical protein
MKYAIFGAVAVLCLISVVVATVMMRRSSGGEQGVDDMDTTPSPVALTNTTTIPPPAPEETDYTTSEPPTKNQVILVQYDALGRPYYPTIYERHLRYRPHHRKRHHYYHHPSPLEPWGGFPDLLGMHRDAAVKYVYQTYPNLSVATIRYGHKMPADTRMDRMIIVYDAFTGNVVSAYIG